jgi:hypothetical protein
MVEAERCLEPWLLAHFRAQLFFHTAALIFKRCAKVHSSVSVVEVVLDFRIVRYHICDLCKSEQFQFAEMSVLTIVADRQQFVRFRLQIQHYTACGSGLSFLKTEKKNLAEKREKKKLKFHFKCNKESSLHKKWNS